MNLERLTRRERQLLGAMFAGQSNKVTALRLGLCGKTVEHHRAKVMRKMEVDSLAELIRLVCFRLSAEGIELCEKIKHQEFREAQVYRPGERALDRCGDWSPWPSSPVAACPASHQSS
jgi:DNA-binding CsgD family transcriptional regulator